MRVLLDTNLLVAVVQPTHVHHAVSRSAILRLQAGGHIRCIVPQNIYEFWAIATRPVKANGLDRPTATAAADVRRAVRYFRLLPDRPAILDVWRQLVVRHNVKGRTAHDARLVAAMLVHGVDGILAFNVADFVQYPTVRVLDPTLVAAGTVP